MFLLHKLFLVLWGLLIIIIINYPSKMSVDMARWGRASETSGEISASIQASDYTNTQFSICGPDESSGPFATQYYNMKSSPFSEYIGVCSSNYIEHMSREQIQETRRSWQLHHEYSKDKKFVDLGCFVCRRRILAKILYVVFIAVLLAVFVGLIIKFAPRKHSHSPSPDNYTVALQHALLFFDAQKSGHLNSSANKIGFRGDSGLKDGEFGNKPSDLVGGFYDSGNNIKFGFPTAYTITLISWSVIEYRAKYEAAGELDHVKNIIRWGSDYLLKTFNNSAPTITSIYSQVGSSSNYTSGEDDLSCWQRPEDMKYTRPVSVCTGSASDLAAEMAAALAAASIVFKQEDAGKYSQKLIQGGMKLYEFATDDGRRGRYNADDNCGGNAANFYNSTGYFDEFVWGGTWLFYATGNWSYLQSVTDRYNKSVQEQQQFNTYGVFDWNSKLFAAQILLARLRLLLDPGYPYEDVLKSCTDTAEITMCSYLPTYNTFKRTPGGLVLLKSNDSGHGLLQHAATAAFLSKLYSDYLALLGTSGWKCGPDFHYSQRLLDFSMSQVEYILGKNPENMSYVVGFGKNYPNQVHHRASSIPSIAIDDRHYACKEGFRWLNESAPNPNLLNGSMVAGPDHNDKFDDNRHKPEFTEPTIAANAGLVSALVAVSSPTSLPSRIAGMIDPKTMFSNINSRFPSPPAPPPPWQP